MSADLTRKRLVLHFGPMEQAAAEAIAAWTYEPPYTLYNQATEARPAVIAALMNPVKRYSQIVEASGGLFGFCCFGASAQVTGGDYSEERLDIGMGMRPDLTGQGLGTQLAQAVFDFAEQSDGQGPRRVTIAEFNLRAIRVWQRIGFAQTQRFERPGDARPFLVLAG